MVFYGLETEAADLLLGCALLAALVGLMAWPQEVIGAGKDGLSLCGNVIVPSLFPFFVVSSLIVGLGLAEYPGRLMEKLMFPLFRSTGRCASALVLGLIGGYPVGARTAAELYKNGQCSRTEAERLLGFCNNSGPRLSVGGGGHRCLWQPSDRAAIVVHPHGLRPAGGAGIPVLPRPV